MTGRLCPPLVLAVLVVVGCDPTPGDIPFPAPLDLAARVYADIAIGFTTNNVPTSCVTSFGTCGTAPMGAPPGCADNPALGAPDGVGFMLGARDRLELGFRCGPILDRTMGGVGLAPDVQIFATVPDGASAVVEVRRDDSSYATLGVLTPTVDRFDLTRIPSDLARFVRITAQGTPGIVIDAVEAL